MARVQTVVVKLKFDSTALARAVERADYALRLRLGTGRDWCDWRRQKIGLGVERCPQDHQA